MKKKSILILTAFPPNSKTAGQNYTKQLIIQLSTDFHIDIVYFDYENHDGYNFNATTVRYIRKIPLTKWKKMTNALKMPFIHPFFSCRFSFDLLKWLKKISNRYEIIYFDFSQTFIFASMIEHHQKILMCHDIIYQKYSRAKELPFNNVNQKLILLSESYLLKKSYGNIFCLNKKDKAIIKKTYGLKSYHVDLILDEKVQYCLLNKVCNYFCLFGSWNRPENIESLLWVIHHLYDHLPDDMKIMVIGGGLPKEIKQKNNKDKIDFTGFVDNPYPLIASSKALLAPIFHGAGIKVKVIEALACGTPVIGTSVALEGIEFKHELCIQANDKDVFLGAMNTLKSIHLTDKQRLKQEFLLHYPQQQFSNILKKIIE